jgi:hypothetical protein
MLPWLLVLYALSVIGTWAAGFIPGAGLVEILIPFCVMAIANGAIYPIVGRLYVRSPGNAARQPAAEHTATGAVLPGKPGGIGTDCNATAHYHSRCW